MFSPDMCVLFVRECVNIGVIHILAFVVIEARSELKMTLQGTSKGFSGDDVKLPNRRGTPTTPEAEGTPRWQLVRAFAHVAAHYSRLPVLCPGQAWWVPKGCGQGPWLSGAHFSVLKANREAGHWPASPGGTLEGPGGSQEWPLLWGRTFDNASCVCDLDCKTRGRISQAQWPISGNSSWFNFLLTTCELRKWWRLSGNGHVRARWRARGSELWENSVPPLCWSLETVTVALRASTICKTVQCLPSCFQIQLKHH